MLGAGARGQLSSCGCRSRLHVRCTATPQALASSLNCTHAHSAHIIVVMPPLTLSPLPNTPYHGCCLCSSGGAVAVIQPTHTVKRGDLQPHAALRCAAAAALTLLGMSGRRAGPPLYRCIRADGRAGCGRVHARVAAGSRGSSAAGDCLSRAPQPPTPLPPLPPLPHLRPHQHIQAATHWRAGAAALTLWRRARAAAVARQVCQSLPHRL